MNEPEGQWVDLGQPCPVCYDESPHLHRLRPDGRLGIAVIPVAGGPHHNPKD